MKLQRAFRLIYPPGCINCDVHLDTEFALCGKCRSDTPFITGLSCDACGAPLPGAGEGVAEFCDDCLHFPRPWHRGRAALIYAGNARRMVLALKHGDRQDLAVPAARWMSGLLRQLALEDPLIVPVPSHWTRLLRRKYNQAALLGKELSRQTGHEILPDGLVRTRRTPIQDGMAREARFKNMNDAIQAHPKRAHALATRNILLIDDVMTSGATFAAATKACNAAGASRVCVLALARVAKNA